MPDFANLDWTPILILYVVLVVSLVFHEAAHALFAKLGGDLTAYYAGQVTLNPIPHMQREPVGTIALPLIALIVSGGTMCFGFAHAPVDALWAKRNPRKAALMSAAGPLSNFMLAGIAFGVLWYLCSADYTMVRWGQPVLLAVQPIETNDLLFAATRILCAFLFLNVLLGVFNLLPLPPLDGAGVLEGLFPRQLGGVYESLRQFPLMFLITIVVAWQLLKFVLPPIMTTLFGWID